MRPARTLSATLLGTALGVTVATAGPLTVANSPLFLGGSAPSNVLFALSVEFPTAVTAAYQGNDDYKNTNEYLGYFDPNKCYDYDKDNDWFFPTTTTPNHVCSGLWSGNFLNWATMTGLDEFRYAMTGGNRYRDTPTLTVIERSYQSGQGGTLNFPDKSFDTSNPNFAGALPFRRSGTISNQGKGVQMQITDGRKRYDYYVRVKVCDDTVGLESNCVKYGSSYKPEGSLQAYGDIMRFGVMSYFQANDIDNAVLRSKLKYVAPKKYSPSGTLIPNPNKEWNEVDGTLITNPDASDPDTANSFIGSASTTGVINYINQFGSVTHSYKTYDDVGKLYYESLKYLRGLSPTVDFYNGATSQNSDNFPVINKWDDPILYSCQKNYIITMGDTHTHCDKRLPGGSFSQFGVSWCDRYTDSNKNQHPADQGGLGGDTIDVTAETNAVGALEGLSNLGTVTTGAGSASYYMSGLAAWAASHDIRPDNPTKPQTLGPQTVETFVIDVNEYQDCGYQSQYWLAAKYGIPKSYDANGQWLKNGNPWSGTLFLPPNACGQRPPPGYNPQGGLVTWPRNLLRASDPKAMIASVKSALASIAAKQIGSAAAVAANSTQLDTGTMIYQARFDSGDWSGQLIAFHLNPDGTLGKAEWDTDTTMQGISPATRKVWTWNDDNKTGVDFTWNNLSQAQRDALDYDKKGKDRLNWLRGANITGFRNRSKILGDIINSDPLFVWVDNNWYVQLPPAEGGGKTYVDFLNDKSKRRKMIYVGANDGMLHAFDADTGNEVFAYVPADLYGDPNDPSTLKLNRLSDPGYTHAYAVDGSPTAWDAYFKGAWHTVLVGSLGAGGKSIYALDITDPNALDFGKPLWEFSHPDLGSLAGPPQVKKLATGEWAVLFGNGYLSKNCNDLLNNVTNPDRNCNAKLFAVNLETGKLIAGFPIDTQVGDATTPNGALSPPAVYDVSTQVVGDEADGAVGAVGDGIYLGDLRGNLWRFVYRGGRWESAYTNGGKPAPLFVAQDGGGKPQPITAPLVTGEPPQLGNGVMVYFGTGSYFSTTDTASRATQTVYGLWDRAAPIAGRKDLQAQTIIGGTSAFGQKVGLVSANAVDWNTQKGWYLDLLPPPPASPQGERLVTAPILRYGRIIFNTIVPSDAMCSAGGSSRLVELDALSGARYGSPVFDLNGDGQFDQQDKVPGPGGTPIPPSILERNTPTRITGPFGGGPGQPDRKLLQSTDVSGPSQGITTVSNLPGPEPRLGWRQLIDE